MKLYALQIIHLLFYLLAFRTRFKWSISPSSFRREQTTDRVKIYAVSW